MLRIKRYVKRHTKSYSLLLMGLLVGVGSSSLVFASVPDISGAVHACYKTGGLLPNGAVRFIDSTTQNCNGTETEVRLNQATSGNFLTDLSGADFRNTDLRYRDFAGANLQNTLFMNTNLDHSDLHSANLSGTSFTGGGQVSYVNFKGADFTNASFTGNVTFHQSDFSNANFQSVSLIPGDVILAGSNFSGVDFTKMQQFSGSSFQGSNFTNAKFRNLQLTNIDIGGGSIATNTDFTNAHFDNTNVGGTDLSHSIIAGATWSNTTCPDFTNSDSHGNTCVGHLNYP